MSIHFNPPVSSDVHLTYTSQDGDHTMSNKEALSHWIKAGDIENFRSFFEGSPSLAELDTLREGFTVLHEAAKQKDPEFVAVVLQHLPDLVNAQDLWDTQTTPLMIAAANGNADTVRVLLEAEARPEAQDRQGWSALFWAVSRNAIDAIKVLLGYERSSEIAHPAPKAAQPEVIRSMLSCCDGNSRTALALAIQNQHWECAEVLLEAGANVGLHGSELQSAAEQAAEQGKMDLLSSIIAQAGPDLDGSSVLIFARFRDDEAAGLPRYRQTLSMLLESGADFGAPDRADSKSLLSAIKIRDFEVAKILIDAGIGLNGPRHGAAALVQKEKRRRLKLCCRKEGWKSRHGSLTVPVLTFLRSISETCTAHISKRQAAEM
ncbi:ankyrin repeat domain-containing protein [Bordetella sp. 15P40C-2]|uniref:ankyrin repeat domain-containing protein n=1 Tax=Bordetella sp. 15P40C-2 TaxID=2572246 RepID=UPI0013230F7B|nr:ankyrin repeat domain-containing protein [Bordetella sp. 15P40C-2]MVW71812.1 hypothetical protein [Bordetella sp. 15P40C-2]